MRDASKERDFKVPDGCTITTSQSDVLDDPEIDMVVEMIGGTTEAKDLVFGAMERGKHVVTANKVCAPSALPPPPPHAPLP